MAKTMAAAGWLASIPWDDLINLAKKWVASCQAQNTPQETILEMFDNPPARTRRHIEATTRRGLKREGMTNKEWRQHQNVIMERVYKEGRDSSDAERKSLVLAAKSENVEFGDLDEDLLED